MNLILPPFGLPGIVGNNQKVVAETAIFIVVKSLVLFPLNLLPNSHNMLDDEQTEKKGCKKKKVIQKESQEKLTVTKKASQSLP
ncbi:hypothetical protein DSO57_1027262 [Entomophthora muscae]|uniref:Uncharacterized protein n=1 Tax=Entomophthora muscae TaxID=34485 RepID=A0ACC2U0E8_9FUNG|nr:hypothetical protein DSO57_1027262 [Entomophthora muscae]